MNGLPKSLHRKRTGCITAAVIITLCAAPGFTQPEPPGPFTDVPGVAPSRHAAYGWLDKLKDLGFEVSTGGCGGHRALVRYEFAVVTQRLHEQLFRRDRVSDRLRRTLANRERVLEGATLIEKLTDEFQRELDMIGSERTAEDTAKVRAMRERPSLAMRDLRRRLRVNPQGFRWTR